MGKLVNMKMTKADRADAQSESTPAGDAQMYPWGLNVDLDEYALDKLKIDPLPSVGETQTLIATVKVTSVSSSESAGGKDRRVGLQITEMCLESGDAKDAAQTLYGGKK